MAYSEEQWEAIQNDYVQGIIRDGKLVYPSLTELSKIHGLAKSGISIKAKAERWDDKRQIFQNKIANRHDQIIRTEQNKNERELNKMNSLAENWAALDLKCLDIANQALDLCKIDLDDLQEWKDNYDNLPDEIKMKVRKHTPAELKMLSDAIEKYQKIGKNAVGETMANNDKPQTNVTIHTIADNEIVSRFSEII